jgi:hypothetical protein
MLKAIKRWLGWEGDTLDFGDLHTQRRPRSATAAVLAKGPRVRRTPAKPPAPPRLREKRAAFSLDLEPEPARQEAFDPYNTGKFDRSASWERISRSQR